ncbi:Gfo/Idh/MocA family oxidoreductase [Microbacterium sp. 4R-513]|uniref:Gfo/Idh/MocA family protein n=1 Tax=Microbacterium sp. 4R-513 TaxID=2567934 RepID=UPI0013E10904|nr:Gfo/Idh/MocA family oxidoreductase [Microbacterium sp. 4R-513]QIG38796.1 Gfo/Idh/MocA family oxidoreductase [Microbacterium sp. 4R-513]
MIDVAVVGLGKMGLSHLAMVRAHPEVRVVGVCDATGYLLDILSKYTGVRTFKDLDRMLDEAKPQALIVATPTHLHSGMIQSALERGIHVFCEKPLVIDPAQSAVLTDAAAARGLVTQVGYHNRFVGAFREVQRLLEAGAIGAVNTTLAEAYGPVVLKPAGHTWRSQRATGGGCLYDYAAHPLNLLTWYLGAPESVSGSQLTSIFSANIDDAVASTLHYPGGTAQIVANWADESQRKMTTKITLWGTHGRIYADRQEIQVYLRDTAPIPEGYRAGWNVRYTTELTEAPWFYLRGEEYSTQLDSFIRRVIDGAIEGENDFASAAVTDRVIAMISEDASRVGARLTREGAAARQAPAPRRGISAAFRALRAGA